MNAGLQRIAAAIVFAVAMYGYTLHVPHMGWVMLFAVLTAL